MRHKREKERHSWPFYAFINVHPELTQANGSLLELDIEPHFHSPRFDHAFADPVTIATSILHPLPPSPPVCQTYHGKAPTTTIARCSDTEVAVLVSTLIRWFGDTAFICV